MTQELLEEHRHLQYLRAAAAARPMGPRRSHRSVWLKVGERRRRRHYAAERWRKLRELPRMGHDAR